MSQSQLQELESLIRQRRLYLQGQDNQIQRNQDRLQTQDSQLSANQAVLRRQQSKLKKLTTDSEKALQKLREQAEREPSERYTRLTKQVGDLSKEVVHLTKTKLEIEGIIAEINETLSKIDSQIIEADGIYTELSESIKKARKRLRQAERDAEFQVAIVTDLQTDVKDMQAQYKVLEATRIFLEQEDTRLRQDAKAYTIKVTSLKNEITELEKVLETLKTKADKTAKQLKEDGEKDVVYREGLAKEKLYVQDKSQELRERKKEMKEDLMIQQQINPQLPKPRKNRNKGFYQI